MESCECAENYINTSSPCRSSKMVTHFLPNNIFISKVQQCSFPVSVRFLWHFLFFAALVTSLSHVWLFVTSWTVARQAPLFTEFSRQEYWSALPFPSSHHPPASKIKPTHPSRFSWNTATLQTCRVFPWPLGRNSLLLSSQNNLVLPLSKHWSHFILYYIKSPTLIIISIDWLFGLIAYRILSQNSQKDPVKQVSFSLFHGGGSNLR